MTAQDTRTKWRRFIISNSEKQRVMSLSYGKDSLAMIGAIQELGLRLDRILHAEIWATDELPADLPEMVAFKDKADKIIFDMTGIRIERIRNELTFERQFHAKTKAGSMYGWPGTLSRWCTSNLKKSVLSKAQRGCHVYIGYAADEPKRIARLTPNQSAPLAEIGWTEADAMKWCERHDLVSPIYSKVSRGGCWFCHFQTLRELRQMRRDFPERWKLMLQWDIDSQNASRGHFFHKPQHLTDYERRFAAEDAGLIDPSAPFRWSMLDDATVMEQGNLFTGKRD